MLTDLDVGPASFRFRVVASFEATRPASSAVLRR
jgi:hypothetical protein